MLRAMRAVRALSSCSGLRTLPPHKIVGLPALSPVSILPNTTATLTPSTARLQSKNLATADDDVGNYR